MARKQPTAGFNDHFSERAEHYALYRPKYPECLFNYLASIAPNNNTAWDCATGNGQSALGLASNFSHVIATDASYAQIHQARQVAGVNYYVALAENSALPTESMALVCVSQALHWFNIKAFSKEVSRVLIPGGILAAWAYNVLTIAPHIDKLIRHFYGSVLGSYWPAERKLIEQEYQGIEIPLKMIKPPKFEMRTEWCLKHLLGYLNTWSAVKAYQKTHGPDTTQPYYDQIARAWGPETKKYSIHWPLIIKIWQKPLTKIP